MRISNLKFQVSSFRRNGFTLIELIIVLVIIGISAGLVGIVINRNSGSFELNRFTKEVSAVLRYARSHAVAEKKTYCFVIEGPERMLRLYTDNDKEDSDEKYKEVINKPIPQELQIVMAHGKSDTPFIEFFPVGNSSGGVIEVSNQKGKVFLVTVNRITGKVEVEQKEG